MALFSTVSPLSTAFVGGGGGGSLVHYIQVVPDHAVSNKEFVCSVPRRLSAGAQYVGRGGAGNVFKGEDELEELARNRSVEQAIDETPERESDKSSDKSAERTEKTETKRRWLFGKKQ